MFQDISENIELGDFNIEDIPDVELPESFNDEFHKKYLTELSARNNPEVMKHFKAKYLSSADLKLKKGFIDNGFTEDEFSELREQEPDTLKLVDLVFNKVKERKPLENPIKDDKEIAKFKAETAKQIESLKLENESFKTQLDSSISENDKKWRDKLKAEKLNSKLNGKSYGIEKEDAIYLTSKKVEDSPFILALDENLKEKVYSKEDPEMEAVIDGKPVSWDYVLDKYSDSYIKKNDQDVEKPKSIQVSVPKSENRGDVDGRYIVGHPDYKGARK